MKTVTQKILLSPIFLLGLFLLLLNDFFLKAQFGNFLTGKLSDFAGLFVFPLFFAAFFPKRKIFIYLSTAVLFVIWKSSVSQNLIDFWNSFGIFIIGRIIDYTDYLALVVLPFSYVYFSFTLKKSTETLFFSKEIFVKLIVILSVFAFSATTLTKDRTISLNREYEFTKSRAQIESALRQNTKIQKLRIRRDSEVFPENEFPNVKTNGNIFFVDFSLKQKFCDSENPEFSFIIEPQKDITKIRGISVDFECRLYENNSNKADLENQHKQELNSIFEREVIEKLRQNNSQ